MVLERVADGLQGRDVALQESQDIFGICHADLLPHDRGGGSNPRDIFKTAGRQPLHDLVLRIIVMDKIDETGRNKVREMTDRGDRKIVLMVIQNERQGADRQGDFTDLVDLFRSRFCGRSNNVVGIFEKMVSRTLITVFSEPAIG